MKRLIYQVSLGAERNSKLYKHCIDSVASYAKEFGIDHFIQRKPILNLIPDPFQTSRNPKSFVPHGGYLPIFEKENAFDLLDNYDQIAIIDADIYIRKISSNIFDDVDTNKAIAVVSEREMDIQEWYIKKIKNYSAMQYMALDNDGLDFKLNSLGYEFFNMGMMVLNSKKFKPYLKGQNSEKFLRRKEFVHFVNGEGNWKWSTDQTLLNFFIKRYNIPVQHLDCKWNGLYTAHNNIENCNFIHFFLKDKLPDKGENIDELMKLINE